MQAYLDLVGQVLDHGDWQENRTGVRTLSIPGAMMRIDLQKGFPALTTKRLAFKSVVGELVGFLRGAQSAATFRELGCKVWDQNANENAQWLSNPYRGGEDDLGPVYGAQWRHWPAYKVLRAEDSAQIDNALALGYMRAGVLKDDGSGASSLVLHRSIDQLRQCVELIHREPGNRRILFHAWNPAQLEEMALPPCHLLYQFLVNQARGELSMCVYIRSNDLGLGLPFNQASAAVLLHLIAHLTGYTPRWLTIMIGDAHIYENHIPMIQKQLTRTPMTLPQLAIDPRIPQFAKTGRFEPEWLDRIEPADFSLLGYEHHSPLTAPMAV